MPTQQQGDENPGFDERSKATGEGQAKLDRIAMLKAPQNFSPVLSPSDKISTSPKGKTLMHRIFTRAHSRFH